MRNTLLMLTLNAKPVLKAVQIVNHKNSVLIVKEDTNSMTIRLCVSHVKMTIVNIVKLIDVSHVKTVISLMKVVFV